MPEQNRGANPSPTHHERGGYPSGDTPASKLPPPPKSVVDGPPVVEQPPQESEGKSE
jgi:hypothetical protein